LDNKGVYQLLVVVEVDPSLQLLPMFRFLLPAVAVDSILQVHSFIMRMQLLRTTDKLQDVRLEVPEETEGTAVTTVVLLAVEVYPLTVVADLTVQEVYPLLMAVMAVTMDRMLPALVVLVAVVVPMVVPEAAAVAAVILAVLEVTMITTPVAVVEVDRSTLVRTH
jgi:hypothetical protein